MQREINNSAAIGVRGFLTIKKLRDGKVIWQSEPMPNKVVSSSSYGRNIIARQLAADTTYPIAITTAAVGSGTNAPADADTGLQSSVVSAISITNMTVNNNVLTVDVFVADATLTNGTYREFGLFCSGQLFARILISPAYTKATGEDTLFSYTLTIIG